MMANRKWILLGAGAFVVIAAVAVLVVARRQGSFDFMAGGQPVDQVLAAAAKAVHFHSTMNSSVGMIEDKSASEGKPARNPDLLSVGSAAPDFSLKTPTGEQIRFSDYRGKTVLLEFFATWCPKCQAETKHLIKIVSGLPSSSVSILAVNADGEDPGSIYAFNRYFGIQYTTLVDPGSRPGSFNHPGEWGPVSTAYKAKYYPTFYVVDGKGTIIWRSDGEQPDALIENELRAAAAP
jgi:peroxiredoxin